MKIKIGITILFIGIIVTGIIFLNKQKPQNLLENKTNIDEISDIENLEQESLKEVTNTAVIDNIKDYIITCIDKKMGKQTNTGTSENKIISIKKLASNSKEAYVIKIKANVNINFEAIKGDILLDTKDFYIEFTKNKEVLKYIDYITIIYDYNLISTNGIESVKDIMKITFKIDKINEIEWNKIYSGDLPSIANEYWQNSVLNK